MARVAVVGAGFGGLATAARLAKLGHEVVLLEASGTLGGACTSLTRDGFTWDAGPGWTLLPAVVRDLFRKTGRPIERELDLQPLDVVREHRFADGSTVALPAGSRAAQLRAVEGLGPGLGEQWTRHVASYSQTWDLLRRDVLERPWSDEVGRPETARLLASRETLHRRLRRNLRDPRLRLLASHPFDVDGHGLRDVPAWAGVVGHVEQRFGLWRLPGGMSTLTDALAARLDTRAVEVVRSTAVRDVVVRGGRAVAVATESGTVDADVVVVAVDPRRLPTLAAHVERAVPAMPPVVTHLGLSGDLPPMPHHETVLHGDPLLVVRSGGQAPDGAEAWTVSARGRGAEDPVRSLAERGVDLRRRVVSRVDRSPRALVEAWGGSPLGVQWEGRATTRRRLGPRTPVPGVYAVGAHAAPLPGLPFVGLTAALVAQELGPA